MESLPKPHDLATRRPHPNAVCDAIARILETATASECADYYIEVGYPPP